MKSGISVEKLVATKIDKEKVMRREMDKKKVSKMKVSEKKDMKQDKKMMDKGCAKKGKK